MAEFVRALLAELDYHLREIDAQPLTLYFGGGTPSMLSPTHVGSLLEGLHARLDLSSLKEWTFEANPRTFDTAKARQWKDAGVTRVSLGVQSWNPRHLETLGRDHSPAEAEEAYQSLRTAGLPVVNIDHMFALPGQSLAEWEEDLDRTLGLQPDHISTYNLTYEEDTEFMSRFQRGEYSQDPDADAGFFRLSHAHLAAGGFDHYEVSNFAASGNHDFRSHHNRAYWLGEDYLGIGPGAVSTVHGKRWTTLADTARYIPAALRFGTVATGIEFLDAEAWRVERIALELRTRDGLRRGILTAAQDPILRDLEKEDLIHLSPDRVILSDRGRLLADSVAGALL